LLVKSNTYGVAAAIKGYVTRIFRVLAADEQDAKDEAIRPFGKLLTVTVQAEDDREGDRGKLW
jgi:hypothetical protein